MKFRISHILMAMAAIAVVLSVALIELSPIEDDVKSTQSTQSTWDHESESFKLRYLDQPAQILESWWTDKSAVTIEMEAPPMEFHLESHDGLIGKTSVDSEADNIKYQITIVHEISDQKLSVQIRILAISPEPIAGGGILETRIRLSGETNFESDWRSTPGFPASNKMDKKFIYLWGAFSSDNSNFIRFKVREAKKEKPTQAASDSENVAANLAGTAEAGHSAVPKEGQQIHALAKPGHGQLEALYPDWFSVVKTKPKLGA